MNFFFSSSCWAAGKAPLAETLLLCDKRSGWLICAISRADVGDSVAVLCKISLLWWKMKGKRFSERFPSDGCLLIGSGAVWTSCEPEKNRMKSKCFYSRPMFWIRTSVYVLRCLLSWRRTWHSCWKRGSPLPLRLWCFDGMELQWRSGKSWRGKTGDSADGDEVSFVRTLKTKNFLTSVWMKFRMLA